MVLAGLVLGDAAVRDGRNALHTQSYGAQMRGGTSMSDVIIAEGDIDYPRILKADILLAMNPETFEKYAREVAIDGTTIVDSSTIPAVDIPNSLLFPISAIAKRVTGTVTTASMVALGIIVGLTKVVSPEAILAAVDARVPQGSKGVNRDALLAGLDEGSKVEKAIHA